MEAYTFIHKETKKVISIDYFTGYNIDFDQIYYLCDYGIPWFVFLKEEIDYVLEHRDFMHPVNNNYNSPSTEYINLDNYEIKKFVLSENI